MSDRRAVRTEHFNAGASGPSSPAGPAGLRLQTVVHEVLPLTEAAEAHHKMDAGKVFGRIVLTTVSRPRFENGS